MVVDKVSSSVIAILAVEAVFMVAFPIVLLVVWRKKTGARMMPALVGAFGFFLFAFVLENLLHYFVLGKLGDVSAAIQNNPLFYTLYGCLAAGLFEETGRLVCARFLMKNYNDRESAVTMGVGHSGAEMILLIGLSMVSYLLIALSINQQGLSAMTADVPEEQVTQLYQSLAAINTVGLGAALMAIVERVISMALHISLSVLVFSAAKKQGSLSLYPIAIGLHALSNVPAALYQTGVLTNEWLTEVLTLVIIVPSVYLAYKQYQRMNGKGKTVVRDLRDIA